MVSCVILRPLNDAEYFRRWRQIGTYPALWVNSPPFLYPLYKIQGHPLYERIYYIRAAHARRDAEKRLTGSQNGGREGKSYGISSEIEICVCMGLHKEIVLFSIRFNYT